MSATVDQPQTISERLESIEADLSERQRELEDAAMDWYRKKRDLEHDKAVAFLAAEGTVAERQAKAARDNSAIGKEEEARYEAIKAVVRVLETRAAIGMSLLKSQGRGA
jgi:hypothetical protein